jgi:hypothetical protein
MTRPLDNPVVRARADRALAQAQIALSELTAFGGSRSDRTTAIAMWDQIEKIRQRLRGGTRADRGDR